MPVDIVDKKLFSNGRLTDQHLAHNKDWHQTAQIMNSSHQKKKIVN